MHTISANDRFFDVFYLSLKHILRSFPSISTILFSDGSSLFNGIEKNFQPLSKNNSSIIVMLVDLNSYFELLLMGGASERSITFTGILIFDCIYVINFRVVESTMKTTYLKSDSLSSSKHSKFV